MKSKRLEAICSFLDFQNHIIDIGCDHAYVCIEMYKRGCKRLLATDIHEKALEIAKKNIESLGYSIDTQLSDGLFSVDVLGYDTLVLAGMGTTTIQHILSDKSKLEHITKIVLQSNNDLKDLRIFMNQLGYCLEEEQVLFEQKHYYTVMKYKKGMQILTDIQLEIGLFYNENKEYYQFLKNKYECILKKIPQKEERKEFLKCISYLEEYLNRI